jgi:hypothetical protein
MWGVVFHCVVLSLAAHPALHIHSRNFVAAILLLQFIAAIFKLQPLHLEV